MQAALFVFCNSPGKALNCYKRTAVREMVDISREESYSYLTGTLNTVSRDSI